MTEEKPMSVRELADFLGVKKNTIYKWRNKKTGPPSFKIGGTVRYFPSDVTAWIREQK